MDDRNQVVISARKMLEADTNLAEQARCAWNRVLDRIEARALSQRPKPRSFEVHHETQVARLALLTALVEGQSPEIAEGEALKRVGFTMEPLA